MGHGAAMLSFRSQRKLIPEVGSNVASEGKLGKRHPASVSAKRRKKCKLITRLISENNNI